MKNNYIKVILIVILVFMFGTVNVNAKTVCKRAKTLHTEKCNYYGAVEGFYPGCLEKYNEGDTITYGSLGTKGTLAPGDAFDCDVNGDGVFDAAKERFYYITDLDTNNNYGVLIYYNNLTTDDPDDDYVQYDSAGKPRENGPISALAYLPTVAQWTNVSLNNLTRKIKDENGTEYISFSYEGHAARLLTLDEAKKTCGMKSSADELNLLNCQHLLENTAFHSDDYYLRWYDLETIKSGENPDQVYDIIPAKNYMNVWGTISSTSRRSLRPVIEVHKNEIEDSGYKEDDPSTDPTQVVTVPDTAKDVSKVIIVNAIICILVGITIISLNTVHKRKRN